MLNQFVVKFYFGVYIFATVGGRVLACIEDKENVNTRQPA